MSPSEARQLISRYLSGGAVPEAELRLAWEFLEAEDPGYVGELERSLGIGPDWTSMCELFREHLAEFADMPPKLRAKFYPELVEHRGACAACRQALEAVRPSWQLSDFAEASGKAIRALSDAIKVGVGSAKSVLDVTGNALFPVPAPPAFGTAMGARSEVRDTGEFERSEPGALDLGERGGSTQGIWRGRVEDLQFDRIFDFEMHRVNEIDCKIFIMITDGSGRGVDPAKIKVRVEMWPDNFVVLAWLSDLADGGFTLSAGEYELRLTDKTAEREREWLFPIEVRSEDA